MLLSWYLFTCQDHYTYCSATQPQQPAQVPCGCLALTLVFEPSPHQQLCACFAREYIENGTEWSAGWLSMQADMTMHCPLPLLYADARPLSLALPAAQRPPSQPMVAPALERRLHPILTSPLTLQLQRHEKSKHLRGLLCCRATDNTTTMHQQKPSDNHACSLNARVLLHYHHQIGPSPSTEPLYQGLLLAS